MTTYMDFIIQIKQSILNIYVLSFPSLLSAKLLVIFKTIFPHTQQVN